jgi:oligopeptide transport system permease protein
MKGSLIPVISYLGPAFAGIITGSLVVEQICGVPGIGTDFVKAAFNRDYTLIAGIMITYSTLLVVLNFVVDILYAFLDPRTKYN